MQWRKIKMLVQGKWIISKENKNDHFKEKIILGSLVAQTAKNLPAMQETWVRSLGWEDPLEEGKATHSSILARRIHKGTRVWRATVHEAAKRRTWLNN